MLSRDPADLVAVHDRVDREHQRTRHGDSAGDVELVRGGRDARGRDEDEREHDDEDSDRHVDEEDPVPVEGVREHPSEQHADRPAARGDEAEHAHRLRALGRLREERHHQRQRDGGHDRAADALHGACADEHLLRRRESACSRSKREQGDAEQEQPSVAEDVAQPAAEQQEPTEGDQVRIDDPRERLLGEPEILLNRRQRNADDRHIEDDHQVAEAENQQGQPACAGAHRHRCSPFVSISHLGRIARAKLIGTLRA